MRILNIINTYQSKMIAVLLLLNIITSAYAQCLANYEYSDPNTGLCFPCGYNCQTCFNELFCIQCTPQFYLDNNNACQKCSFGCSFCTNATSCSTCNDGLYLTSAGTCRACSTGVATCTIATIQTCQDNYFLLGSICAGCLSNCKTCSDFVTCSTCQLGYYLAASGSQCLSCPSNCRICSNSSSCAECNQGYTQSGITCILFSCSSIDPFCIACTSQQCLTCQSGKYLSNGTCLQGASVLCLQANGQYYTDCVTSGYGCMGYSQVQTINSNQVSVCLPKSATKLQQYIYLSSIAYSCNGGCSDTNIVSLSYSTSQTYYQVTVHASVRFYSSISSRSVTIKMVNENGSSLMSQSIVVDASKQISKYNQQDGQCLNCIYAQKIIEATFSFSGGQYLTNFTFSDSAAKIQVVEIILQHDICQVTHCSSCTSSVDCLACFNPYYLQLTSCVASCDSGFYLYGRACYLQCPIGSYTISSSYTCQQCVSPCSTCSNATSCLSCLSGYFLQGDKCLTNCSSLYLFANTTSLSCESCPNPCVTCYISNSSEVKCLSCAAGYLYSGGSCIYICPAGTFGTFSNGSSQCLSCDASCTSCYINSTTCSSCSGGYLLYSSVCANISFCPTGYYEDTSLNRCLQCKYPCKTCSGTQNNCTSCARGPFMNNNCLNGCPLTYFADYSDSNNVSCKSCVPNCINCISLTSCVSCVNSTYLYEGACQSTCPDGFYQNTSNSSCTGCIPPCKTCSSASLCLSCASGYLDGTSCTLQCNYTSYVSSNFICTKCLTPCQSCYSQTSCLLCELPYLLFNQTCISEASCLNKSGYYPSYSPNQTIPVSGECYTCAFPCGSCSNNSVSCTSCVNGYLLVESMKKCFSSCPISYFVSGTVCEVCNGNCYQCSVIATNCTVCSGGLYLDTITRNCVSTCPNGYYGDDQSQICVLCVSPCGNCFNPFLCITCTAGILYEKTCVSTCPSSTFYNSITNICVSCTNNCLTCSNSSSSCLSCPSGFYLSNNSCLTSCPSLFFGNDYSRICQSCISPCLECTSSSSCQSCIAGFYFFNNQCVSSCSTSYYADNITNQCLTCNTSICLTCEGRADNCKTCIVGYYLYNSSCNNLCPSGYYPDSISGTCSSCPFPCSTCLNYTFCSACLTSYYLFSNRCFSQCPIGYYSDAYAACQPCIENCQICTSSTVCLSCLTSYYILNSTCLSACPVGYYQTVQAITNYDECAACQNDCINCTSYDYCVECKAGLMQFNGLCLSTCPIFYYSHNSSCSKCGDYCASCINSTHCLTCIGTYLLNYSCVSSCPAKTYPSGGSTCVNCTAPCLDCTGDYTCTSCLSGYIYFHNYCVLRCPSDVWYYSNNNTCNANCPYNKLSSNMTCYVGLCGTQMVSLNGYCLQQCSTGYYVNNNQQCTLCSTSSLCSQLFEGDLQILYTDVLTLVLYYNQKAQIASFHDISISFVDIDNNAVNYTLTSYEITQYKMQFKFDSRAVSLVNVSVVIPYVQSEQSQQRIFSNRFKKQLASYKDFSSYPAPSFIGFIPAVCFLVLLVLLVINVINKASRFVQILDYVQLVAVTLYLNIQYPPILEHFLAGFKITIFALTKSILDITPYTFSPPKFIFYHTDTLLLRNQVFVLLIFFIIFLAFIVLIALNTYKKEYCKQVVRMVRYRLLNDLFSISMTPLFLFACQFSNLKPTYLIVSIVIILLGLGYVTWISYKIIQIKRLSELSGLLGDFQRTQSKIGLMYIPFAFLRRIIFTLGLGIAPYQPISTITLLLVLTFLIMVCIYFYQPFDNQYTDYVTIFMESSLTLYVVCLIVLGLNVLEPSSSNNMGIFTVSLVTLTMGICLGWLTYLTITDIRTKGWCPQLKEEPEIGSVDYSEKKYDQDEEQIRKMEGLEGKGSKKGTMKAQKQKKENEEQNRREESANELMGRFGTGESDDLFSKNKDNNDQFRHWSEESSHKGSEEAEQSKKAVLPHLLLKVQRNEDMP